MAVTIQEATGYLNQSLSDLGYGQYQIPTPDGTNDPEVRAAYQSIAALAPSARSALLDQVVAILKFRNYATMFDASKNPVRKFFRNDINFGGGEEDIYHEIVSPIEGNWASDFAGLDNDSPESDEAAEAVARNLVRYYNYKVTKKFHTTKKPLDIPLSISEYEQKQIFTPEGFTRFIDVKMANMQWSAEIALLGMVIADIRTMVNARAVVAVKGIDMNTPAGVTDTVEKLRTYTDAMKMPSVAFNSAGILTLSSDDDIFLFCTPEFVNRLQTRGYANAFNVEYYREHNKLVVLPYGTNLGTDEDGDPVQAVLIDRRAIVESIFYWEIKPFVVANTDYTNYFLKGQVLSGYNEFFNAIAFSGDAIGAFNGTLPVNVGNVVQIDGEGVLVNDPNQ